MMSDLLEIFQPKMIAGGLTFAIFVSAAVFFSAVLI